MPVKVFGLEVRDLPEGEIPVEAVVVVKALTAEGESVLSLRYTSGLAAWDRAGLLRAATLRADTDLEEGWVDETPRDEEQP